MAVRRILLWQTVGCLTACGTADLAIDVAPHLGSTFEETVSEVSEVPKGSTVVDIRSLESESPACEGAAFRIDVDDDDPVIQSVLSNDQNQAIVLVGLKSGGSWLGAFDRTGSLAWEMDLRDALHRTFQGAHVAVDGAGDVLVAGSIEVEANDTPTRVLSLRRVKRNGLVANSIRDIQSLANNVESVDGVAVDITHPSHHMVLTYRDESGQWLAEFDSSGSVHANVRLDISPLDIAVGPTGQVGIVGTSGATNAAIYNGVLGTGDGTVWNSIEPHSAGTTHSDIGVAVDGDGSLFAVGSVQATQHFVWGRRFSLEGALQWTVILDDDFGPSVDVILDRPRNISWWLTSTSAVLGDTTHGVSGVRLVGVEFGGTVRSAWSTADFSGDNRVRMAATSNGQLWIGGKRDGELWLGLYSCP